MRGCQHTSWLGLCAQHNDTTLLESDRLHILMNGLPNPELQQPSMFVLVGNTSKFVALREMFGVRRSRRFTFKRAVGDIHLHLDPSSNFHSRPIFIADADFPKPFKRARSITSDLCHKTTRWTIQTVGTHYTGLPLNIIAERIFTHLLFPFTDVFCVFCADFGGLEATARHIASFLDQGQASILPRETYSRIIIATEYAPPLDESKARDQFLNLVRKHLGSNGFEDALEIEVVTLCPKGSVSTGSQFRHLKERLMAASDDVRKARQRARKLFAANHFAAFFTHAARHFSEGADTPFDFIQTSRAYNPVPPDLNEHILNFLQTIQSSSELTKFAAPMIASSLLLDSYPPDAHVFSATDIFEALYRNLLSTSKSRTIAFKKTGDVILRSGYMALIERYLFQDFDRLVQTSDSSAMIHQANLKSFREHWSSIQSNVTCLCCLRRRPQYRLSCEHSVCENCVLLFAERDKDDPWMFYIRHCFLCGMRMTDNIEIRMHPPTAGVGLLCLDGGGSRGMAPLTIMERMYNRIDLPVPFQRFFKLAFGVSSGALIIMHLFVNGHSIEDSIRLFEKTAQVAFKRRGVLNIPWLSRIYELIASIFTDGLYPAKNIEAVLKEVFGIDRSIFDHSYASTIGTKIGLPVATVDNPSCQVFTNYNGVGEREEQDTIIRPKEGAGRVALWKIARSVSAAVGFFPPKHIPDVGTFQDAGPLENDPILTALCELATQFPFVKEPDFVLSLGTGEPSTKDALSLATNTAGPPTKTRMSKIWKTGMVPRLCDLVFEKMRDRKVRELCQRHPRYHRLNIEFDGAEPRLDDTESISSLKSQVYEDDSLSSKIDEAVYYMISSLFYFELSSMPKWRDGKYCGTGLIRCALRRREPGLQELLDKLGQSNAKLLLDGTAVAQVRGDDPALLDRAGEFKVTVDFETVTQLSISLKQANYKACDISNSPYTIENLVRAQGLDAVFGSADHGKRKAPEDTLPARKRQRTSSSYIAKA